MNKAKQILVLLLLTPLLVLAKSSVSYAYDLRGWLTNISTGTFTEELFYTDGPGSKYCNGNISSIRWKDNTSSSKRGYKFTYDTANRLTSGAYGEGDALGSNTNRYTESMSYDANGNIISLKRYGKTSSGYGLMDNLTIAYTGNQPTSVSESASDNNTSGAMEYKKANGSGYKFNGNGSLQADKSRGIAYITYDLNNNPKHIYFMNGSVTKYVYSASGQKLRTVHYTAKPNISRTWGVKPAELTAAQILQADSTDYLMDGKLMMKNGSLDKLYFDGGYVQARPPISSGGVFLFYFYNQDHLGNIHEVVNANGNVQQVTNYYPFGAPYADTSASTSSDFQPYKYNGKELDKMHGLNTYDYGARQHDPILARWDRIDPLCEKYYNVSTYAYCHNNPIRRIDPDGKDDYYTSSGQFLFRDQKETDYIIVRDQFLYNLKSATGAEWINPDTPIEDVELSAEAYSNIFTNVLSQMEGVDVKELHNQKVSVTVWRESDDNLGMYTIDRYNDAGKASATLAETGKLKNGDQVVSCYVYPQGTKEKSILNTVSNLQNLLGVHEFLGHYKNGWRSHNQVVPFQRNHKTWQKATNDYKNYINDVYKK